MRATRSKDAKLESYTLPPITPSFAIEAKYRRKLDALVLRMNNEVIADLRRQFKDTPPLAMDEGTYKGTKISDPHMGGPVPPNFTGAYKGRGEGGSPTKTKIKPWLAMLRGEFLESSRGASLWYDTVESAEAAIMRRIDAETPSTDLDRVVKELRERWVKRFDDMSQDFAEHFATDADERVAGALKASMKKHGWTVKRSFSSEEQDVLNATISQSVALIKSIPSKYFDQVESAVQRSVQYGRDLGRLSKELQKNYGVTKRRAALIARDQNNKATAALTRVRQQQLGITEAIWVHSTAGKEPRPSHAAAGRNKVRYDVSKGWFDPNEGRHIFPGELINCRCICRSVIPGFA